jgi:hypothetical protein
MFPSTFYILSYFYLSCQLLFCEVIYNLLLIHLFPLLINKTKLKLTLYFILSSKQYK